MTELRWTRNVRFVDRQRGFEIDGPGVYDVPDDAVEDYLDHRSGGWEEADEADAEDVQEDDAGTPVETGGTEDVDDVSTPPEEPAPTPNPDARVAETDADTSTSESESNADAEQEETAAAFDPAEYTVPELEDELSGQSLSDAELDALREAEADGKNRDTALEAIDDARQTNGSGE